MLLVMPILIPFVAAILGLFAWDHVRFQRIFAAVGMTLLIGTSIYLLYKVDTEGIQVTQIGGWAAPVGITLVADLFSAMMLVIISIMGLMITIYSIGGMERGHESFGYYPLLCTLMMGVCGAFITGDIFNLYVWFEVLLISSFVLLSLGGERRQLTGGIQYVTLNLLSSAFFLIGAGILYAVTGTLNMADLSIQMKNIQQPGMELALALMFFIAFGIKAAIFPMFYWLPVSYHTPPIPVTAIFAALLTKVGVYSLIRIFTLIFVNDQDLLHPLMLVLAAFTMVAGVFGAMAQYETRRLLSFHIVSQVGYMLMGLAIFTPLALAGAIYFMIHNMLAKTNLFLITGIIHRLRGTYDLHKLGGLYKAYPLLSVLFLIPALSLAGVPPLSGFWGKLMLIRGGLEAEQYGVVAVALFVSLWTLYSMIKIWSEAFLKDGETEAQPEPLWQPRSMAYMVAPVVVLAALSVGMGLAAEPCFRLSRDAAEQLLDPTDYIQTVLGEETEVVARGDFGG